MATSYLTLVNDVLIRLREPTVATVTENDYSSLIGKLVNDALREVADSWDWEVLKETYTVATVAGTVSYTLTGSGFKFKIVEAINDNNNWFLGYKPADFFTQQYLLQSSPATGSPYYYTFNGNNANTGDCIVDVFPQPDGVYTLRFNGYTTQEELTNNTDTTELPKSPIIALAWAKAIEERGEDGGVNISSQYAVAKQALSDAISIEAGRRPESTLWYPY